MSAGTALIADITYHYYVAAMCVSMTHIRRPLVFFLLPLHTNVMVAAELGNTEICHMCDAMLHARQELHTQARARDRAAERPLRWITVRKWAASWLVSGDAGGGRVVWRFLGATTRPGRQGDDMSPMFFGEHVCVCLCYARAVDWSAACLYFIAGTFWKHVCLLQMEFRRCNECLFKPQKIYAIAHVTDI